MIAKARAVQPRAGPHMNDPLRGRPPHGPSTKGPQSTPGSGRVPYRKRSLAQGVGQGVGNTAEDLSSYLDFRVVEKPVPSSSGGGGGSSTAEWRPKWQFTDTDGWLSGLLNVLGNAELMTPVRSVKKGNPRFIPDPDYADRSGLSPPQPDAACCYIDNTCDFETARARAQRVGQEKTNHSQRSRGAKIGMVVVKPHVPNWMAQEDARANRRKYQLQAMRLRESSNDDSSPALDTDEELAALLRAGYESSTEGTYAGDTANEDRKFDHYLNTSLELVYEGFVRLSPNCCAWFDNGEIRVALRMDGHRNGLYKHTFLSEERFYECLEKVCKYDESFTVEEDGDFINLTDEAVENHIVWPNSMAMNDFLKWPEGDLEKLFHSQDRNLCVSPMSRNFINPFDRAEEIARWHKELDSVDPELVARAMAARYESGARSFVPEYGAAAPPSKAAVEKAVEKYTSSSLFESTGEVRPGIAWLREAEEKIRYIKYWTQDEQSYAQWLMSRDIFNGTERDDSYAYYMRYRSAVFMATTEVHVSVRTEAKRAALKAQIRGKHTAQRMRAWMDKPLLSVPWGRDPNKLSRFGETGEKRRKEAVSSMIDRFVDSGSTMEVDDINYLEHELEPSIIDASADNNFDKSEYGIIIGAKVDGSKMSDGGILIPDTKISTQG